MSRSPLEIHSTPLTLSIQCALEASRQDAERKDRKRKRDQQNHPNRGGEGEEGERGEHSHLQKHIKKTTETSSVVCSVDVWKI